MCNVMSLSMTDHRYYRRENLSSIFWHVRPYCISVAIHNQTILVEHHVTRLPCILWVNVSLWASVAGLHMQRKLEAPQQRCPPLMSSFLSLCFTNTASRINSHPPTSYSHLNNAQAETAWVVIFIHLLTYTDTIYPNLVCPILPRSNSTGLLCYVQRILK